MIVVSAIFTFALGLAAGSFVNVASLRLPKAQSLAGWSHCPQCRHRLAWYDLIPVISFLILGGKCRYCKKKISRQYALVEIGTGLLVVLLTLPIIRSLVVSFSLFGVVSYSYFVFLAGALATLFVTDLKSGVLPDVIVFPAIVVALLYRLGALGRSVCSLYARLKADTEGLGQYLLQTDYLSNHTWWEIRGFLWVLAGAVGLTLFFYLLVLVTKGRGMGLGDVKLGFLIGLAAGWPGVLTAVFVSFLLGALVSGILLLLRVKKFGETIPFGPFLVSGTVVSLLFGDEIVGWYLGLL